MDHRPDGSFHKRQPYLTQSIVYMIPGMYKSNYNLTPVVKPSQAKNEGSQPRKNDFNYRSVIVSLNLLTKSKRPEAQFVVR